MDHILVVAEHLRDARLTGEVIGLALQAKSRLGGTLSVAVISSDPAVFHPGVSLDGVDEGLSIPAPSDHFRCRRLRGSGGSSGAGNQTAPG